MPTGPMIGIYSFADASVLPNSYTFTPAIGVFGRSYTTFNPSSGFAAGIVGVTMHYGGVGVYGAVNHSYSYSLPTTSPGTYAGYFDGNVKVTSTLTAAAITTTSDERLKENIQPLNDSVIANLQALRPVEYKLKADSTQFAYEKGAFEMEINHYGLVAQEVQKLYPNVVYEDENGYLSINYIELIPILIKSIQNLSTEVSALKIQLDNLHPNKK